MMFLTKTTTAAAMVLLMVASSSWQTTVAQDATRVNNNGNNNNNNNNNNSNGNNNGNNNNNNNNNNNKGFIQLTSKEFHDMATSGQLDVIIDVRTQAEFIVGHIENATLMANLGTHLANAATTEEKQTFLQQDVGLWNCRFCRVAVYGRPVWATVALEQLVQAGFPNNGDITLYHGLGVMQWKQAGYSLVKSPSNTNVPCMTGTDAGSTTVISKQQAQELNVCRAPDNNQEEPDDAVYQAHQQELDTARTLFLAQLETYNAISYSFLFTLSCFCPPADYPWLVTANVQLEGGDDTVVSAITAVGADVVEMEDTYLQTYSMLDLFDKIQDAIDKKAYSIRVLYNSDWGFAEEIAVDYDMMMADEEFYVTTSDFTINANQEGPDDEVYQVYQEELDAARTLFLTQFETGGATSYSFLFTLSCECLPADYPWIVTAEVQQGGNDDTVVSAITTTGADVLQMEDTYLQTYSMLDLFDKIQDGINERAYSIRVEYNSVLGYPENIVIDYDAMMADEELYVTTSDFAIASSTNNQEGPNDEVYQVYQEELDAARTLFLGQLETGGATSYSFLFTLSCNCLPADYPWLVTAEVQQGGVDDTVVSAITTAGTNVLEMDDTYLKTYSMLDLFDTIQDAIDKKAYSIRVVYNSALGYPEDIVVDYDAMMADEELYVTTSDFAIASSTNNQEGPDDEVYQAHQEELDAALTLFLGQLETDGATSYSFLFTLSCNCLPADYPWLVTAEVQQSEGGDTMVSAITTAGADVLQMEDTYLRTYSMLDLFDLIQEAIDVKAADIRVVYNSALGYPEDIAIDYDEMMADEELYINTSDFAIASSTKSNSNSNNSNCLPKIMLRRKFKKANNLWNSMGLTEYYFQYHWISGGMLLDFPWSVHVKNGRVVSATDANGVDITTTPNADRTMEDIFSAIQGGIDERAYLVQVQYDEQYGYPMDVWIDFDPEMADEEISITVSYFSTTGFP